MRSSVRIAPLALVVAIISAGIPGRASWFNKGQPVPQWAFDAAKSPTPASAKESATVILYEEYLETVDPQGRALERKRYVTRILKPQGRNTVCEVSYDETEKLNYFRAWTIANDEKNTYQAQDSDFLEHGDTDVPVMLSSRKLKIARPPALDVGAVLVCESEELMRPYSTEKVWHFQNDVPYVYEALEIDLPPGHAPISTWHNHETVKPLEIAPGHFRWEMKDVPALDPARYPFRA